MKNLAIIIILLSVLSVTCRNKIGQTGTNNLSDKIENGLLPTILIEGDSLKEYNILDRMEHYKVPGVSMALLNNWKIEWAKGYGYTDSSKSRPVDTMTLFQAASINKPVVAMAALFLVEKDQLSLDEDVNHYLKNWQVFAW